MEETDTGNFSSAPPPCSTTPMRQTTTVSSQCRVCGVSALYSYYGAVVCHSCKVFFKRNAETKQKTLKCDFDGHCEININNRRICSCCRLTKCFGVGMLTDMLRSAYTKKNKPSRKKKLNTNSASLPTTVLTLLNTIDKSSESATLNLLQSNQLTLSVDQWNRVSNLVHYFDEHSGCSFVERFIQEQHALPIKFRFKCTSVSEFFTSMMSRVQLVFEKNRDHLSLSLPDRTILLRNTVEYTATIGGMFILRQVKLLDDPTFFKSVESIFQPVAMTLAKRAIDQLDPDDTFIKLILAILAFSTINYTIYRENTMTNLTNVKAILPVQDMYTELAWRYLLHKYGHQQTVIRFSNLIRCLFLVNETIVEACKVQQFIDIINFVVKQTEQGLTNWLNHFFSHS